MTKKELGISEMFPVGMTARIENNELTMIYGFYKDGSLASKCARFNLGDEDASTFVEKNQEKIKESLSIKTQLKEKSRWN